MDIDFNMVDLIILIFLIFSQNIIYIHMHFQGPFDFFRFIAIQHGPLW